MVQTLDKINPNMITFLMITIALGYIINK